jgi:hypothetical protein
MVQPIEPACAGAQPKTKARSMGYLIGGYLR